ncbi:DNA primase large subunit [Nematocida sp. LUAm3]|nr:DNA primase large subunit [Nematocida sp. LUAm3]KAI5175923.1 DNA primase large subunit [Nematocida sp. LUAm2]KAI5178695.1 DNA primase large subunit [Nematocida sp. LUAm1]
MRKSLNFLTFYLEEIPNIYEISKYYRAISERMKIYDQMDRSKYLPLSAMFSQEFSLENDVNQHFCMKILSAMNADRVNEFVRRETTLFRLRIENSLSFDIFVFFAEEYLSRLEHPFSLKKENGVHIIEIDGETINWFGKEKKNNANIQKIIRLINVGEEIKVRAHFTHFYHIKERVDNGKITSGLSGVQNILIKGFSDILQHTTIQLGKIGNIPSFYEIQERNTEIENIQLEEEYMPLCIKEMFIKLRTTHHLKHQDRVNLINFLKNVGVPLSDAILLFKKNFQVTDSDFQKKYLYIIRHGYGQEGAKKEYKSIPCRAIIPQTGCQGCTGCPLSKENFPIEMCSKSLHNSREPKSLHVSPVEYYQMFKKMKISKERSGNV